jgi:cbb3-type cytochrome oxidase maturation protein
MCLIPLPVADALFCSTKSRSAMAVLFVLIGVSLLVAIGFLAAFFWASYTGQYDDDYTPSVRILFDEELSKPE